MIAGKFAVHLIREALIWEGAHRNVDMFCKGTILWNETRNGLVSRLPDPLRGPIGVERMFDVFIYDLLGDA